MLIVFDITLNFLEKNIYANLLTRCDDARVITPYLFIYLLRSYFPTSHISKFSLSLISYAGLGIYSTISSYAGCSNFSYSEMFGEYSILHVEYALLVTQNF